MGLTSPFSYALYQSFEWGPFCGFHVLRASQIYLKKDLTVADTPILSKTEDKTGHVQRQVVLPFIKSLEISFKSIRVRFFRSLITTMSLVLAVSFLSFVSVSNDVANGMLVADNPDFRATLAKAGYDVEPEQTTVGSSAKQRWILILSLLVCVVGIVNAQLMAVTERFREIGTMKCLGALDRFVLRLFILEAGIQGFAGAFSGAFFGAVFSLLSAWLRFGSAAVATVSLTNLLISVAVATGVGVLLSLLGVFYPALLAARMQPVEAMRVEQ
jgi:ABC-type antimicrobial peptide transport system permease subunit